MCTESELKAYTSSKLQILMSTFIHRQGNPKLDTFPILHVSNYLVLKKWFIFFVVCVKSQVLEKRGSVFEPYIFMQVNKEAGNVLQVSEIWWLFL